jgi:hypothetical protein
MAFSRPLTDEEGQHETALAADYAAEPARSASTLASTKQLPPGGIFTLECAQAPQTWPNVTDVNANLETSRLICRILARKLISIGGQRR